jgi:hypothetical protein
MHARVAALLAGRLPDRLPFVGRLENWLKSHQRAGTLPLPFQTLSLPEIHRAVGMGQQRFITPYGLRLRGVEVRAQFQGQLSYRADEPVIDSFPGMWDVVSSERPGVTNTEIITPVGRLTLRHEILPEMILAGEEPYLTEPLIKTEADYHTVHYILERAEIVPHFERLAEAQAEIGEHGYVVPLLHRLPFQQILLEYLGTAQTFYALHDQPSLVEGLLAALDEQMQTIVAQLATCTAPYVEFPDNLHASMTNPRLFQRYCLPAYQRYTAQFHAQGKKVGSHTDGDVRPLLRLLAESGLDVCESFSPYPLTACSFEDAWSAWEHGPLIWGGIPSPWLEERTSEPDFEARVENLLALIGQRPIILNVVDLVLGITSIERISYLARRVEAHRLN